MVFSTDDNMSHAQGLVASFLLMILTSPTRAEIQQHALVVNIANMSAPAVGIYGTSDVGVSQYSVSRSDVVSALSTLNGFRRSVRATRMNYVVSEIIPKLYC